MAKVWTDKMRKAFALKMKKARAAKRKPARKRAKNPPARLVQPFKVAIGAVANSGSKKLLWFDGKNFRATQVKRAKFSSIGSAKVMARSLIKKYPILRTYQVGIYAA